MNPRAVLSWITDDKRLPRTYSLIDPPGGRLWVDEPVFQEVVDTITAVPDQCKTGKPRGPLPRLHPSHKKQRSLAAFGDIRCSTSQASRPAPNSTPGPAALIPSAGVLGKSQVSHQGVRITLWPPAARQYRLESVAASRNLRMLPYHRQAGLARRSSAPGTNVPGSCSACRKDDPAGASRTKTGLSR